MDVQIDQLGGEWDVRGDGDVASRGVRRDVVIRDVEAVLNQNEAHLVVVGGQTQSWFATRTVSSSSRWDARKMISRTGRGVASASTQRITVGAPGGVYA